MKILLQEDLIQDQDIQLTDQDEDVYQQHEREEHEIVTQLVHNIPNEEISRDLFKQSDYLQSVNTLLAQKGLDEVLQWCYRSLPGLYQVTSFGSTGMVILHAMSKLNLKIPIIFLNTLHHFEETLEHARQVEIKYGLAVHWYQCKLADTREDFERIFRSTRMWVEDPNKYEQLTKVEPLERALSEKNVSAWITGRRRDQGGMRKEIPILEVDAVDGRIKVNPLAYWTKEEIWAYLRREGVPYNPLFDQSYTSIGDSVTTAKNDDPQKGERDNRFYQIEGKTECGIHTRTVPASTYTHHLDSKI